MVLHALRRTSGIQRLMLLVLASNVVLLLLGLVIVPSARTSPDTIGTLLGAILMQAVLATLALVGPLAFAKYPRTMGISLGGGAVFALVYLTFLTRDFAGATWGPDDGPTLIYSLFVSVALLVGALASARSQRLGAGVAAGIWALLIGTAIWSTGVLLLNYALWGSAHWYQFWLQDGAVDDFHRSGSHDLSAFLLQDLHGALFFHQVLSAVIGGVGGLVGSALALAAALGWKRLRQRVA
jgi:hypothetical protein